MPDRTIRVRLVADIQNLRQGLNQAASASADFGRRFVANTEEARRAQEQFGRGALLAAGALTAAGGLMAKAAIDWESAFAGVEKTVDGTTAQLAGLEDGLREMARTLPATHGEIAAVAEAAGALGVETGAIESFTRVMIDLGETTNLTADAAATAFARIANVMGTAHSDFDRMGSTIVALGNNGASTEAEIAELANRLAAAGAIAGLSESDVFAFAETLASVGVEAEAGGTALSKVFTSIRDAVLDGGEKLEVFATVAGMSAAQFASAFREDAAGAITSFIEGLGGVSAAGQSTTAVFEALELTDQRLMRALLSTGEAGDYLRGQILLASDAWEENNALGDEAAKRYDTTAARIEIARNNIADASIELTGRFLPAIAGAADGASTLARGFGEIPGPLQSVAVGFGGIATAGLGLVGTIGVLAPKINDAKLALEKMGAAGNFLSRNMGKLAAGLGIAGVALAAYSVVLGRQAREQAETEAAVESLTQAILEQGAAYGSLTDVAALQSILEGEVGAAVRAAGTDLDIITEGLRENGEAWADLAPSIEAATQVGLDAFVEEMRGSELGATALGRELIRLAESGEISGGQMGDLLGRLRDAASNHALAAIEAENQAAANEAAGAAARGSAGAQEALAASLAGAVDDADDAAEAVQAYADAVGNTLDPFFGLLDAERSLADARQGAADAQRDVVDAQREASDAAADLADAQADVAEALAITADRAAAAEQGIQDLAAAERGQVDPLLGFVDALAANERAQRDARRANTPRERAEADAAVVQSAVGVEQAAIALAGAIETGQLTLEEANSSLAEWVAQGLISEDQAARMAERFAAAASAATDMEGANVAAATATAIAAAEAEAAVERAEALADAQERVADAQERVVEAQERLIEAQEEALRAQDDVTRSAQGLYEAQIDLGIAIATGNTSVDKAKQLLDLWVDQGLITRDEADRLGRQFETLAGQVGVLNAQDDTELIINSNVGDVIDDVNELAILLRGMANEGILVMVPPGVAVPQAAGGYAGHPEALAAGGFGRRRGTDTIPAMLTPGEFVIRQPAAAALGSDFLHALNHADSWVAAGAPWAGMQPTIVQVPVPERKVTEINAMALVNQDAYEFVRDLRTIERRATLTRNG